MTEQELRAVEGRLAASMRKAVLKTLRRQIREASKSPSRILIGQQR